MHINPIHIIIAILTGVVAGYCYRQKAKLKFKYVAVLCVTMGLVIAFADWVLL